MKKLSSGKMLHALKAFTLLELVVVIAIIVVLSAILVPAIAGRTRTAKIEAANGEAYKVYTAAQGYMGYLQKYNKDASKYFGRYELTGTGDGGNNDYAGSFKLGTGKAKMDSKFVGYLSVNDGFLEQNDNSLIFKKAIPNTTNQKAPVKSYYRSAFLTIAKKYMGYKDTKGTPDNTVLLCEEMNKADSSFVIVVYPDIYSVRCAFYTSYMTNGSGNLSDSTKCDEVMKRIFKYSKTPMDNKSMTSMGHRGFSSLYSSASNDRYFSQETVSASKAAYQSDGTNGNFGPAFMGQYPLAAYNVVS